MSELVTDCPRCRTKRITFDVRSQTRIRIDHGWKSTYEAFAICRHCDRATIFVLSDSRHGPHEDIAKRGLSKIEGAINDYVNIEGFINLKDVAAVEPPEHLPKDIESVFKEGATCLAVGCYNAAGTMFRLCVDMATRALLPNPEAEAPGLNAKVRRDLGLRLPWLFENKLLPVELKELSACIKEDGNDGAHAGTLKKPDADDLVDFTTALLERIYTEPERLRLAKERRDARRGKPA